MATEARRVGVIRNLQGVELCMSAMHLLGQNFGTSISCHYVVSNRPINQQTQSHIMREFDVALARTILRHPVLQVGVVGEGSQRPAYVQLESIDMNRLTDWRVIGTDNDYDHILRQALIAQLDAKFAEQNLRPGWRVLVLQHDAPVRLDVTFTWNHHIMDGIGGKLFHESLLSYLNRAEIEDDLVNFKERTLFLTDSAIGFPPSQTTMCPYPLTFGYALKILWEEFKPQALQSRSEKLATWAIIKLKPHETKVSRITVNHVTLERILSACRAHDTTLTGLLHSLTLVSLATLLPAEHAKAFEAQTAWNMRPYISRRSVCCPELVPNETMSNIFSAMSHCFGKKLVARIRNQASHGGTWSDGTLTLEPLVWEVAAATRAEICQTLKSGTKNNIIGVMRLIPDWIKVMSKRASKKRSLSWLISNLGVLDGCSAQRNWIIDRASFAICAVATGAAIQICPISIKGGRLCINVVWQEGVVEDEMSAQLTRGLEDWLLHIAKK